MRHRKDDKKLGRSGAHRRALVASLVCGLIQDKRIRTTLPKAKLARKTAEKMVTLARQDTVATRRAAIAKLHRKNCVYELFNTIAPKCAGRKGGYTRIARIGTRGGDGADMAILEWVDFNNSDEDVESDSE